jgi:hypothetical protein
VYTTYSGYRDNDHQPYVYFSEDAGQSWMPVHTDLPVLGVNDLFIVPGTEDKVILVGTDGGVYLSVEGSGWQRVGNNMPYMPVYDIDYNPVEKRVIAATFSRGIMTFPVEELEVKITSANQVQHLDDVQVYPTVFDKELTVDGLSVQAGDFSVSLVSMAGEVVWSTNFSTGSGVINLQVPATLQNGVYVLQILQSGDKVHAFKVVKI